jgi:hypothetical protein
MFGINGFVIRTNFVSTPNAVLPLSDSYLGTAVEAVSRAIVATTGKELGDPDKSMWDQKRM